MTKIEIVVELMKTMMEKDWNFPFDETLAEPQPEQWDNHAIERAVSQAAKIIKACK